MMTNKSKGGPGSAAFCLIVALFLASCGQDSAQRATEPAVEEQSGPQAATELSDAQVEEIVWRSYQYVAMYNVNNKMAFDTSNPLATGALNRFLANTQLVDHTLQIIARPNNDTLYVVSLLDLTQEPVIIDIPAFDSKYVSLMLTGYDHYVNIPMSTRQGHFAEPSRILLYSARTPGYSGEPVEGVDEIAEMTGDFVSAVLRVMPHGNEPERMQRNIEAMQAVKAVTLSEFQTGEAAEPAVHDFPDFGQTDFDTFENNLLEVMQFVFNHTTFVAGDEVDREVLAAYAPLGVVPGRSYDPEEVADIDGARFRAAAEKLAPKELAKAFDPTFIMANATSMFLPKGQMTQDMLTFQSVLGPIGQPATEAVYPSIGTADGLPMNAMNDYVIRMGRDDMPPATAFWSMTLYDSENGFFMPNDRRKYSVGENAGMKLDEDGGLAIHIAAEQPAGVPDENWLPLVRGDYAMDIILRIYAPDLQRLASWEPPRAEPVE